MRDYIKRFLIAGIVALCVGLLFLGGRHSEAAVLNQEDSMEEWIWPADGIISDTYGTRQGRHKGIDIAGKLNSPIYAADGGMVEKSYYSDSYGNVIFIHHPNDYVTVYAHLSTRMVTEGQNVRKGEIIGEMGRSGQATGVHLHFETHKARWTYDKKFAIDPEGVLGHKGLGEIVQAVTVEKENALEASSRFRVREERRMNDSERDYMQKNKYIVQRGDTLMSISQKKGISVDEILKINHLTSDFIKTNQVLILP